MKVILLRLSEKGLGRARPHVVLWATTAIPETLIVVEWPQMAACRDTLAASGRSGGPAGSPQGQDAVMAEPVPTARLVGVVEHGAAEGTLVALFQLLHKLVLHVRLKVQGNGVARILAGEATGHTSLLLKIGHPGGSEEKENSVCEHQNQ